jgi:hypothetical protein
MIDKTAPSAFDYFIRNISRLVSFDVLSFFGDNRWHDAWSETRVVKIRNYENAMKLKNDIENIGQKENN